MSLPLVFLPEAQAEFDEAIDWYERQARKGSRFLTQVEEVLQRIKANPRIHQVIYKDVRRGVVRQFPYCVMYREEPNRVLIVSVFNSRRDPSIWQRRV